MKKKIVIACLGHDLSGGGAERVALVLLKHLNPDLFSVELSYLRDQGELHHLLPSHITPTFFSNGTPRFRNTIMAGFRGYRAIARRADILFGMMEGIPSYLVSLIGALENKPSIGWNHIATSQSFRDLHCIHRILMPYSYAHISQMVCVSEGARTDLMSLCNFKKNVPITIYNPLDIDSIQFLGAQPLPQVAHSWYKRPTVIGVGRLVEQKRIDLLIQAFAAAIRNGLDANLILLGQGHLQDGLQKLTEELGISTRVLFAGFVSNPYPYIKAASVLAMSSDYEGLGMVLLEAMALGTPVVSTDCQSGPREVLQDGRSGILVPVDDPDGMAVAISTMMRDEGTRSACIINGLKRVEDFYPARIAQQFESLFMRLVRQ
jgi:glycosyltransferase involved in cell wall biosynthesis